VARNRKDCVCWHGGHGENITAALLGKVSSGGGCPRFVVGTWVLGLTFLSVGYVHASGVAALLRQRSFAFRNLQLLPATAAVEDGALSGHFCERGGKSARRNGISPARLCGDAEACASVDERTTGNALGSAAQVEAACGTETAEAPKIGMYGADAIAFYGDGGTAPGVLAGAVLRFQCVQPREEEGKVELHAREPSDSRTREASERLAVEQLGFYQGGEAGHLAIDVEE
jgi:hypothetical protein